MQRTLLIYFLFLFSTGTLINCDHVPMVLWNIKGASISQRPVAAFEVSNDKNTEEFLQSTLKDGSTGMVVYVGDKLSMEDLAPESSTGASKTVLKSLKTLLDGGSHIMLPSVKDPLRHFRNVDCGIKDIHAGKHSAANLEKSIETALEDSCVIIVHLGNKGLPANDNKLSFKASKKNIVGVFTASKSSWHPTEELHRRSRSLLAAENNVTHFINITGCIIMYAENFTISVGSLANNTKTLEFPSTVDGGCEVNETRWLTLTFDKTASAPEVILTMNFKWAVVSWEMVSNKIRVMDEQIPDAEFDLKIPTVNVPLSFSYACGKFTMSARNSSTPITMSIDGFQIQPYNVTEVFSSSFNCVGWFTLPIWMGIFVTLLFIAILNSGIYVLFNIKTMDRFDDPKGKTISVTVGD